MKAAASPEVHEATQGWQGAGCLTCAEGTATSPEKSVGSVVLFPGQHQQWKAQAEAGQAVMPFAIQTTRDCLIHSQRFLGKAFTASCP